MCDEKDRLQQSNGDVLHTIARAGLSAIPVFGGAAAELFSSLIVPPLTKRRDQWIREIGEKLERLEQKIDGFCIESLAENETFITIVLQATQTALRNHNEEKLSALRNAVLNSAVETSIDDNIQQLFIVLVDSLTPLHLRIIKFLDNPTGWGIENEINFPNWTGGAPSTVLEFAIHELRGRRDLYDPLVRALYNRGLISVEHLHTTMTRQGMFQSRTTPLGKQFIRYISLTI